MLNESKFSHCCHKFRTASCCQLAAIAHDLARNTDLRFTTQTTHTHITTLTITSTTTPNAHPSETPPTHRARITVKMPRTRAATRGTARRGEIEAADATEEDGARRAAAASRKSFERGAERSKEWLKNSRPPTTREAFLAPGQPGCPDPVFDEYWDQDDEDKLQRSWVTSLHKVVVGNLSNSEASLHALWKVCIHMFGIDPFSLLNSELRVSTADSPDVAWQGQMVPSPLWPPKFCQLLARLITHPFFNCRVPDRKLRFYLKWAVICRTDDRRPLQSDNFSSCLVIESSSGPDTLANGPGTSFKRFTARLAVRNTAPPAPTSTC